MSIQPRLLLNFDLNGTVILRDSSKQVSDEYMIISALAETILANWSGKQTTSFKDYVYTELLPGDKSNPKLKLERQKVVGEFLEWLKERNHPALASVEKTYSLLQEKLTDPQTKKMNFTVFSSFFVMMDRLREKNIPFTIILRTFGHDLAEVMKEIKEHPSGVGFFRQARFQGTKLIVDGNRTVEKTNDIFDLFLNSGEHFAIQDDWPYWNRNKEQAKYGKPFLYDRFGKNLSLFFDDNITGDEESDIINPCEITGENIPTKALCDRFVFKVDTMEAMLNDNYFIDRVMQALEAASH